MKQLVILSGKGGTGKTSISAAFAHLSQCGPARIRTVFADADVDAANLELVLRPDRLEEHEFTGGKVALIDEPLCEGCGICEKVCRFEAIQSVEQNGSSQYRVDSMACEGCAACFYQCPTGAISMREQIAGRWFRSESRYGPLFHAELLPAKENSGKLVAEVKKQAQQTAIDTLSQLIITDGPPGIGCPVIAAVSGADLALVVTEPTAVARHDLLRVLDLIQHFRLPVLVCINKADIFPEGTLEIMSACSNRQVGILGGIPFDGTVTRAVTAGEPVTVYDDRAPASLALVELWYSLVGYF